MFGVQSTHFSLSFIYASSSAPSVTLISCHFEQKVLGEFQNCFKSSQWFCWVRRECWSQSKVTSLLNSPATPRRTLQLRTRRHPTNTTVPSETCQETRKLSASDKDSSSLTGPSASQLNLKRTWAEALWLSNWMKSNILFTFHIVTVWVQNHILYLSSSRDLMVMFLWLETVLTWPR